LFIFLEALMSTTGATNYGNEPSRPTECRETEGYRACFYPGFVRRLAVRAPDGTETLIYEQEGSFVLPPGHDQPWPCSTIDYSDPKGRRMMLQIYDPGHEIDRIEVHFKSPQALAKRLAQAAGAVISPLLDRPSLGEEGEEEGGGDVVVCENVAVLCPPICPG
jgi:hypothetical protein